MHALCVAFVRVCVVCVRACVRACARVGCCGCVLKGQLRSGCGKEHEAPRSLAYRDASAILAAGYPCYPPSNEAPLGAAGPVLPPAHALPLIFQERGRGHACMFTWHTCMHTDANLCACVRACAQSKWHLHRRRTRASLPSMWGSWGSRCFLCHIVCGFTHERWRCTGAPVWASCFDVCTGVRGTNIFQSLSTSSGWHLVMSKKKTGGILICSDQLRGCDVTRRRCEEAAL